jgi:1,4-alpha-glucan branching enzyme
MRKTIRFTYHTGIARDLFENAVLTASWDAQGGYSDQWSERPMKEIVGADGCPAFTADVDIEAAAPDQVFYWGVRLDCPAGKGLWAIQTEENDHKTDLRRRAFTLGGEGAVEQAYYLNHSRRVGAQKHGMGIRFTVWAPNAQMVELCMANVWPQGRTRLTVP